MELITKLSSGDLPGEVPEKRGVLLFVWINGQKDRLRGSPSMMNWFKVRPYISRDLDGRLLYQGSILQHEPLKVGLYELLNSSALLKWLNVDIDHIFDKAPDYRLICSVFKKSQRLYTLQFPDSKFVVVNYPMPRRTDAAFRKCFSDEGIAFVDLAEHMKFNFKKDFFPDWHPRAHFHERVASALIKSLGGRRFFAEFR